MREKLFGKIRFGLIFLWISSIPGWMLVFDLIPERYFLGLVWETSWNYNRSLIGEGNVSLLLNPKSENWKIKRIKITKYIEREGFWFQIFLWRNKKEVFEIKDKKKIWVFFSALKANEQTDSQCHVQPGYAYYLVETFNPDENKKGLISLYFCIKGGRLSSIVTVDDTFFKVDYLESHVFADYLVEIGLNPALAY